MILVLLDRPSTLYILVWVIAFGKGVFRMVVCVKPGGAEGMRCDRPIRFSPSVKRKV